MKIVMFGDSITDAGRDRAIDYGLYSYGHGYVKFVAGELLFKDPEEYKILNRGISGNRVVDLYARIKADVWNEQPDVLSILIGINDIWHEVSCGNGVDIVRFEKVYRMLIEDTLQRLPNLKIILCEPFVLTGSATGEADGDSFKKFSEVRTYAKVVKKIAEDYGLYFLPLQEILAEAAKKWHPSAILADGVHPAMAGAKLIANEWLSCFENVVNK